MNMREQFESRFKDECGMAKDSLNQYINADTAAAWDGWQAARTQGDGEAVATCACGDQYPDWKCPNCEAADSEPPAPAQGVPDKITPDSSDGPRTSAYVNGWNDCVAAMLSTTPGNGEWVDINQRVPELTGWFIVAITDPHDIGWSTEVSWAAFWNGDHFEECDPIEDGQPVTHWMPFPQPPVQGGE